MRIQLVQANPVTGDIEGNVETVRSSLLAAREQGVDLAVFPEQMISGFRPGGLLKSRDFLRQCENAVHVLARETNGIAAIVGTPLRRGGKVAGAAVVLEGGEVAGEHAGAPLDGDLWADGVTVSGRSGGLRVLEAGGLRVLLGLSGAVLEGGQEFEGAEGGRHKADIAVDISACMYHLREGDGREEAMVGAARKWGLPVLHVNGVGGQDGVLFGGRSLAVNAGGAVVSRGSRLQRDVMLVAVDPAEGFHLPGTGAGEIEASGQDTTGGEREEELYTALVLGLRDYVEKNAFAGVVLGLSGGIDSALTACIAVDALGRSRVHVVSMPSRYSSEDARHDAERLAANLGVDCTQLPIDGILASFLAGLEEPFRGKAPDITEENLQARIRGNLLMALSNKFGWLLLATGNKSEAAVGYATLYGDLAGGYSVLSDVLKTDVYRLAEYVNRGSEGEKRIPVGVLTRAPSAELRPDQIDQDALPEYAVLDRVIRLFVEEQRTVGEIVESGIPEATVREVVAMISGSEFKRRQGAPGTRVSRAAFGVDWCLPVTSRFWV